jgi:hypothetical protein
MPQAFLDPFLSFPSVPNPYNLCYPCPPKYREDRTRIERIKRISTDLSAIQMNYPFSIRSIRTIRVPQMPQAYSNPYHPPYLCPIPSSSHHRLLLKKPKQISEQG